CRNDYFGSDPAYGITKECDLWVANTTPPPSQDAGTPPPQDAGAPPPRDSPALGTPRSSARFFISGHSLTYDPFGDYVVSIAQSLGSSAQYNEQIMMGSAIHYRVRGNGNESDTGFDGYSQGLNRGGGSNMNVIQELRHPQTLGGDLYDTLLITERYDLLVVIDYDKTARYLRHVHERLIEGNPQANTYFFEPWYSVNDKGDPRDWIAYQRTAHPVWKCVATRINQSLAAEGRRDRIASLPAATAMAELIERATQGNVDGVTGSSVLETVDRIISDDVHMTLLGKYYMALVTYGALYRRSPIGAWFPNDVTSTQANSLQHIAWDYVSNYYASGDSALNLAQCQTLVQNSFCNTYWNYYSDPGQIPNCLKRFAQQDDGNPFYYNATTDSGYWFPAPP
ncbi:MAG TPA: hypothetical protein VG963_02325, partial [Polyangiaceae bacterium]|nr:hypothetical protein [Polyangiaceae bacterium]